MMGIGAAEFGIIILLLSSVLPLGLPLGLPPEPENPVLSYAAPEDCLYYAAWSTMAKPNAASENHTERLLAEPELKEFVEAIEQSFSAAIAPQLQTLTPDQQKLVRLAIPQAVRTVITRGTTIYVNNAAMNDRGVTLEGGLVIHVGEDAATLRTQIVQLLEMAQIPAEEVAVGTAKFSRVAPTPDFPNSITFGAMGPYLLAGIGDQSVEKLIERLKAKKVPTWLTKMRAQLPVERRGSESYINLKRLVDEHLPLAGPEADKIATSLGIKSLGVHATAIGLDQHGTVTRTLLTVPGPAVGLLQLAEGEGLKDLHLRHIPSDVVVAGGYSLNATKLYDMILNVLRESGANSDQEMAQFNEQFREMTGLSFREDLLPALGDTWTFHMSPVDGWYAGISASVEVTDKAKIELLNAKIAEFGRRPGPQPLTIGTQKVGTNVIYSVRINEPGIPIQPSWCVTNDRVHFAMLPAALRPMLADPPITESLFAKQNWFKQLQATSPVLAVSHQDSAKSFEIMYQYFVMFIPIMMRGGNLEPGRPGPAWFDFDTGKIPSARSIHRHLQPATTVVRRNQSGIETETHQTIPSLDLSTAGPVAVALLLPAVQASREASRKIQGINNLKQIGLAVHNFHDTNRGFPPVYLPVNGKPGLSWRVAILPFIEQQALYQQFKLDEPWDSEHNRKLIPLMPKVYLDPTSRAAPGMTTYLAVTGEKGTFTPPTFDEKSPETSHKTWKPRHTFARITDGTANTAMVVTATDEAAVIWTKPDDYIPSEKETFKSIAFPGGKTSVLRVDGSVTSVPKSITAEMWLRFMYCQDGMPLNLP